MKYVISLLLEIFLLAGLICLWMDIRDGLLRKNTMQKAIEQRMQDKQAGRAY